MYSGLQFDVMGVSEIAKRLGVSRQRADQIVNTKGFPDEAFKIGAGRGWVTQDVEIWISAHRSAKIR